MGLSFVIMQIGNAELDLAYRDAIVPAILACGLEPKRVDKHNEGRLLKSEIVKFIESSDIIIADLTNERPNCYLEVGYAMGLDKFRNLILTAREDHFHDSPNYKKEGPKIHFDLSGYDILFWTPNRLDDFREELEKRIKRRMATLPTVVMEPSSPWDEEWISKHQNSALNILRENGYNGFMEIRMGLPGIKLNLLQSELLRAAEQAQINTIDWPLGIVFTGDNLCPRPTTDGILAEVIFNNPFVERISVDYWTIKKNGLFYLLKNLSEDMEISGYIFFNTRVVRITECLLYSVRLYSFFKIPSDARISIGIRHSGLKGRILNRSGLGLFREHRTSQEDEIYTEIQTTFEQIESNLVDLVDKFTQPLFVLFDFFELDRRQLEDIVNNFVAGRTI